MDTFTHAQNIIQSLTLETIDENIIPLKQVYSKINQDHVKSNASKILTKMILSLLSYIESKKETSHHKAIPLLISISDQLKTITLDTDITQYEINQIVIREIQKFKTLKQEIISRPIINQNDIDDLNSVILAMDWEITDSTINNFIRVVEALSIKVGNHRIYKPYLTIIQNTGKYIGTQKAQAHSDSISFLKTIFERFRQLSLSRDMSLLNKKENLDEDIKRFQQFKQKISVRKEKYHYDHSLDDESMSPALSHVSGIKLSDTDGFTPVTQLPDEDADDAESVQPALAGKANPQPGSRDVMGDLFNLKDSPADELLDAIHLMDVHGSNPDQAAQMLDRMDEDENDGVTKFIPERIDNEPISEIGDRLDEFFNLENTPASTQINKIEPAHETPYLNQTDQNQTDQNEFNDLTTIAVEEDDGIVPFGFEDDDHTAEQPTGIDNQKESQHIDLTILNRLKTNIGSSHWLTDQSSFLSIKNDISLLEKKSETELNHNQIFEVMFSILDAAHGQSKSGQISLDQTDHPGLEPTQPEQAENEKSFHTESENKTDNKPEKPTGFFGKIKSIFGS